MIGEEYAAQPETATQKAGKRIENYAYGESGGQDSQIKRKDAIPFAGITVMGNQADKVGNMSYMPRHGTPIEVERGIGDRRIPFIEFLSSLVAAHGPISRDINRRLREKYGDSLDTKEAEEIIATFTGTVSHEEPKEGEEAASA